MHQPEAPQNMQQQGIQRSRLPLLDFLSSRLTFSSSSWIVFDASYRRMINLMKLIIQKIAKYYNCILDLKIMALFAYFHFKGEKRALGNRAGPAASFSKLSPQHHVDPFLQRIHQSEFLVPCSNLQSFFQQHGADKEKRIILINMQSSLKKDSNFKN